MTINATGSEDAWQRQCLIEVTSDSTHIIRLSALSETVEIDMGERDLDKIDLLNLGQIPKHGAVGITTITIEGYPLEAQTKTTATGTAYWDIFASAPVSGVDPGDEDMTNTITRYRVAILWTNDADCNDASDEVDSGDAGMRFVMAECFCTSCKTSYTDKVLKQTLVFKGVCFDKTGAANIKMESTTAAATSAIPTLGNYTAGTTKWA